MSILAIPEEKWRELPFEEQTILKSLGFKPEKPKERKNLTKEKKPFILGVYISCCLCGREHSTKWKMSPYLRDKLLFWKGLQLKGEHSRVLDSKQEIRNQTNCKYCREELLKLEKETIIRKLIILAKDAGQKGERKL